jgi:hypothetical protein
MAFLPSALSGSLTARARRKAMSASKRNRATEGVELLLAARRFHPRIVAALSTREHFAGAVKRLATIAESDRVDHFSLPPIFADRMADDVLRYRLAVRFGLRPRESNGHTLAPLALGELRRRASKGENVRIVLACLGEIQWGIASTRVRAAFCLRALIAARRGAS